jgi:predicted dehydrogenase
MKNKLRVLVVGCGHMGVSHARAYRQMAADFAIVGLVSRGEATRRKLNAEFGGCYPEFGDYYAALAQTKPDAVCISTYSETHAPYGIAAFEAGAHVFLEKPIADNIVDAERVVAAARRLKRKLVIGYILNVHPAWRKFTELARTLGKPLVMRMNLNQQSAGDHWATHRKLLRSTSPLVDCGVHYVDVMCRMTGARPVRVNGIAARLADDIVPGQVNYGHLQVTFDDGSIGWYEAGWGPMMSETAFFVKDVVGPKGCVSIVARNASAAGQSSNIDAHTKTEALRVHHAALNAAGGFAQADEIIDITDEPDHDELCRREQEFFLCAIRDNLDLTAHLQGAVDSLRIVLAADQSFREGRTVTL